MDIEQELPNKPNFGLILGLFCASLLVVFVLALLFVRFDGKHLVFRHSDTRHPVSSLTLPAAASVRALASA